MPRNLWLRTPENLHEVADANLRPGFKYINSFEFRDLSAVNEVEQQISGI
jgi:hypothetical protein